MADWKINRFVQPRATNALAIGESEFYFIYLFIFLPGEVVIKACFKKRTRGSVAVANGAVNSNNNAFCNKWAQSGPVSFNTVKTVCGLQAHGVTHTHTLLPSTQIYSQSLLIVTSLQKLKMHEKETSTVLRPQIGFP